MAGLGMSAVQRLAQQQKLTPQMLQKIDILAMPVDELRERIYEEVEKNPALEVVRDASYASAADSDRHQSYLESRPAREETLQGHLLSQLAVLKLTPEERNLGERIIQNLDDHGWYLEPCETLLSKDETIKQLDAMIVRIRQFEPAGICCSGIQESLLLQAQRIDDAPLIALILLEKHFDLLETPRPPLIARKLQALEPRFADCTPEAVEEALAFIRTLDPHPARQFEGSVSTVYAAPEVIVRKATDDEIEDGSGPFILKRVRTTLPDVRISPDLQKMSGESGETGKFAQEAVKTADAFLSIIQQRSDTVMQVIISILKHQQQFFEKGPGNLLPLRMLDVANELSVHESTVSRVANGKYLRCEWGMFELRYFFSSSVASRTSSVTTTAIQEQLSRDSVKEAVRQILEENQTAVENGTAKRLSDEKIAALLSEKGMSISRRTVAKYRSELNIKSSFDR